MNAPLLLVMISISLPIEMASAMDLKPVYIEEFTSMPMTGHGIGPKSIEMGLHANATEDEAKQEKDYHLKVRRIDYRDSGFYSICTSGKVIVAVGEGGVMFSSLDGITWKDITSKYSAFFHWRSVVWNGSQFLATADHGAMTSADGIKWYGLSFSNAEYKKYRNVKKQNAVSWNGSKFIRVGDKGTQPPPSTMQ